MVKFTEAENTEKEYNTVFKIEGMMCQHCVRHVTNALNSVEGTADVVVDLDGGQAFFTAEESNIEGQNA